jgi:disulfide bond formation protein DsbB
MGTKISIIVRTTLLGAGIAGTALLVGCGKGGSSSNSQPPPRVSSSSTATPATPQPIAIVGDAAKGRQLFADNCSTCHGDHGQGVAHLGKDLQTSKFVAGLSDAKLVAFIEHGRSAANPLNTTHVAMPPRGGNPALHAKQLYDIVAYIRLLQKSQGSK